MPNRLFVDEIVSVGAVSEGDNPDAEITFWKKRDVEKRDVPTGEREKLATRGAAMPDGSFPIATIADLRNAIQAFGRAKNKTAVKAHIVKRAKALGQSKLLPESWTMKGKVAVKESRQTVTKKGARMAEFDFEGFTDEQRTAIESQFTVYEETISALEQPEEEPDVVKEAPAEIQELIAKQAQELEDARAEIAKERKVRRDAEFLTKAKDLEPVLGDPAEWGPVLDQIQEAAPEAYEKLSARLVAAKAQIETGDLFKELGRAGDGEPDKLAALTKAKMELHPELTVEQARAAIWRENPDLVQEARSL